ncbi:MAG: SDR family oxidoreductase [Gammaproteobacteria bacterium]
MPSAAAGAFGAARAGLNFLVKCLALELGPHGIRVNAACPLAIVPAGGLAQNPGLARMVAQSGKTADALFSQSIPLGRPQTVEETASVMAFLALDATFVSGEAWTVAGGAVGG